MKHISKWLIPGFLRRLDDYLLENQPVIWRTQTHFVLFYAIVASLILFAIGFFYPISYTRPIVDPIEPIEIFKEIYYIIPLTICIIAILYWAYLQYTFPLQSGESSKVLLTLFAYAIGLYILLAFTPVAFRMGTIVKTAYHWMYEEDIEYLKKNNFFLYGIILLPEDSIYQSRTDTFFQRREAIFKDIWRHEDTILENRYNRNQPYWSSFSDRLSHSSLILIPDSNSLSQDQLYLSSQAILLDRAYLSYMSYRPALLYLLFQSNRYKGFYLKETTYLRDLPYTTYLSYRSYWLTKLRHSDGRYDLDLSYPSYWSDYTIFYYTTVFTRLNKSLLAKYNISPAFDTIAFDLYNDNLMVLVPICVYQLEDAVRSVQHARLYLQQGIFRLLPSLWNLLLFLPLICLQIATIPYLSYQKTIGTILLYFLYYLVFIPGISNKIDLGLDNIFTEAPLIIILIPSILSLLTLMVFYFLKKQNSLLYFSFHLLIIFLLIVIVFQILGIIGEVYEPSKKVFFSVQIIVVVGLLLMAHLSAQPKTS